MKADDLVVTAKRSWGYRKWLVLRSLSQGIPFFESAPERERRGKERLGDGFGFGAYGTTPSLFFFSSFFDSTELNKTTREHSRWWCNTKQLFMESLSSLFHVFYYFASFFFSLLCILLISLQKHMRIQRPTQQSWLKDIVTLIERAQVICLATLHLFFFNHYLLFSYTYHQ